MIDLVLGLSVCILEINLSYSYSWNSYAGLFCPELLASDSNPSAIVQASGSRGRGCEEGSMPGDHHRHDQPSHRHHSHKVSQGHNVFMTCETCICYLDAEVAWRKVPQVASPLALAEQESQEERGRGDRGASRASPRQAP